MSEINLKIQIEIKNKRNKIKRNLIYNLFIHFKRENFIKAPNSFFRNAIYRYF